MLERSKIMAKRPVVLLIMDGFGINEREDYNAIAQAKKPNLDMIMKTYPWKKGYASGLAVGLPDGQMGNSEVGHMNMGAGRIIYQELTRITKEIEDGDFFKNEALLSAVKNCKEKNSALHLMGLLSDGGVHSHITHMYGLLELAKKEGLDKVYLHCFLDGRDTPPKSGRDFVADAVAKMNELGVGKVATVMGRYYAMDRDNRWDRVELAYKAMVYGEGNTAADPVAAIESSYGGDVTDEFVVPTVIERDGAPVATIKMITASSSLTSVLTGQERYQRPSVMMILTDLREEAEGLRLSLSALQTMIQICQTRQLPLTR